MPPALAGSVRTFEGGEDCDIIGALVLTGRSRVLSIVVLIIYVTACLLLTSSAFQMNTRSAGGKRLAGLSLGVVGLVAHGVDLSDALLSRPELALNVADTASLIGWIVAALAIGVGIWRPRFTIVSSLLLSIAAIVAIVTDEGRREFTVTSRGWELTAHIIISTVAYAFVTVGAALGLTLALLDRRLRHRQPLGWMAVLPSLEALESGMFLAIGLGFALLSLALFSGFFFVQDLFAQHLIHKTVLSLLAWMILATLLVGRWRFGWRGRLAINWTFGGFLLLGLAYFGSKWVLETLLGRHWG